MSNKTLIIGDMHIGKGIRIGKPAFDGALNSRVSDQVRILNRLLEIGINREVNRFIITGDIFEELKPDTSLVVLFMDWLKNCADYGIECHIIAGNHDLKRVGSKYSSILDIIAAAELSNVVFYNKIYTLNTEGVSFTLVPFRDRRSLEAETVDEGIEKIVSKLPFELADIPIQNVSVLVGHLALAGSFWTDEVDDVSNELMVPLHHFAGYDYVWMGHVHKPQVMKKRPYIAHVGSIDISDFGETKQQKIVILFDPDTKKKFETISIPTRPLRLMRLDVPKGELPTDFIIQEIKKIEQESSFKNALVKAEIKILDPNAPEIDRDKVFSVLKSLGTYHICNFSESRNVAVIPTDKKYIQDSAIKPKAAVKLYADGVLKCDNKDERTEFISLCNEIIDEFEVTQK